MITNRAASFQPALLSTILALAIGTPATAVVMILLGAPLTTHLPHTLLAAAHLAVLAFMPLIYTCGVDGNTWRDILALMLPLDEVLGAALGTLLIVTRDREWQKWPVTIVTAAYVGYVAGKYLGAYAWKGKRIELD
ncbi:MAG: Glycosylphosphatidylinositol (GPI) anchor assembly protein [Phylliscum demangeonii]|nr:MAG: Glycosylphosphatidylinositol (GPI) anchor assembly protein [Phylliscum demangeonii]